MDFKEYALVEVLLCDYQLLQKTTNAFMLFMEHSHGIAFKSIQHYSPENHEKLFINECKKNILYLDDNKRNKLRDMLDRFTKLNTLRALPLEDYLIMMKDVKSL